MAKEVGIGLTTKTVLHFLNIQDDRDVTLITNEVSVKDVLKIMIENDLPVNCLINKKIRQVRDGIFTITAITFE
jgi:hypothetical protein